jgi:arylsulfatase A-like enzyme/tetratricopeptide (TPR) repeat protein
MLVLFLSCFNPPPVSQEKKTGPLPPDIFFITIDTLRADRLGAYGDKLAKTPNIDKLALDSIVFQEAHSVTPLTLPSHASMLTGLYPKNHGLRDNSGFRLNDDLVTVAEKLKEQNYATGAFVSAYVLSSAWGLDQGFDTYHDPFHPQDVKNIQAFGELELPAAEVINSAMAWWRTQESPRFAWLHLYDPHEPWNPEVGSEYSGDDDPYRAEIAKVDRLLQRVFSVLDDDVVIIVTSDHGESLWEGGEREHGVLLHRSVTRVPLLIRPPGGVSGQITKDGVAPLLDIQRPDRVDPQLELTPVVDTITAGKVIGYPVSGVDIAPTILSYAGIEFTSDGIDLRSHSQAKLTSNRVVYAETLFPYYHYGWYPLKMVLKSGVRLEQGVYNRFFNPTNNHQVPNDDKLADLIVPFFGTEIPTPGPVDSDVSSALAALGYVTDQVSIPLDEAPDPREEIETLRRLQILEKLPVKEAIPGIKELIQEKPKLIDAKITLAVLLSTQGKLKEALLTYSDILQTEPYHSIALNNAVVVAHELKEYKQAISFAEQMNSLNDKDPRAYRYLAAIYAEMEQPQEVIRVGLQGLQCDSTDPNLNYLVGLSYIFTEQPAQAEVFLTQALLYGSRATDINLWQGIAAQRIGNIDKATKYYQQAMKDMPSDLRAGAMAGMMLADLDRCDDARGFLINVAKRGAMEDRGIQSALQKCNIK